MKNIKLEKYRWILAILMIVTATGCQGVAPDASGVDAWAQQVWGTLRSKDEAPLTVSGAVQANQIRIAAELGGRIIKIKAQQGDAVQAGQVLVLLDATPLWSKLAEAEAAVLTAQADLDVLLAGPRADQVTAMRAALTLAQAQRDGAYAAWQNALVALRNPQDLDTQIVDAQTKVKLAEQGVALALAEQARQKLILDQKAPGTFERDVAQKQYQATEQQVAVAQADLATAQTLLDGLQAIRRNPLALIVQARTAQGQFDMAEAGVAVAQARLDDLLAGPTAEQIAVARATVALAQAQADAIRAQQDKFTLRSPADGVVLLQNLYPGEVAAPAAPILTVSDISQLTLVVYVSAQQIGRVQVGQEAQVTVDSFPGRTFIGYVSRIGDQAEFTPRNVATKEERQNTFYAVYLNLPNPDGLLKPGMPADAVFK